MDKIEYRKKFQEYLADDVRYKKFLAIINRGKDGRLLFWQERAIEKFCGKYSLNIPSYEKLREVFDVCELHGTSLEQGKVEVFRGHVDYSQRYLKSYQDIFPNSHLSKVNGPEEMQGKHYDIRFCKVCRYAESKWKESNA